MRALSLLALLVLCAPAHAVEFNVVRPQQSSVTFISQQMGVPVEGVFKRFDADISIDPAMPEKGRARISIDIASIDTGNDEANEEVVGRTWFDARTHPAASFVSTTVRPFGSNRYEAQGKLTIKGRTLDTRATFAIERKGDMVILPGSFTLSRLAYSIGTGIWSDTDTVADEVQVRFRFAVAKQ